MTEYAMNNIDQYGDGYMEQEEEWEREGLLDPAWEKQQKKVRVFNVRVKNRMNRCVTHGTVSNRHCLSRLHFI